MRRLTLHLKNVEKVNHNGKPKIFNTLSFNVSNDRDVQASLSSVKKDNITKQYFSNIK